MSHSETLELWKTLALEANPHFTRSSNHSLELTRNNAWNLALGSGFPTRQHEDWKYTSLKALEECVPNFSRARDNSIPLDMVDYYTSQADLNVLFIDGILRAWPDDLAYFTPLAAEFSLNSSQVLNFENHTTHAFTDDTFFALNTAVTQDGCVIEIPKNTTLNQKIHICHFSTRVSESSEKNAFVQTPRVVIRVGENAEISVMESFVNVGSRCVQIPIMQVELAQNARVRHGRFQEIQPDDIHVSRTLVSLQKNAFFETFQLDSSGAITRNDLAINLIGEGAECQLSGLSLTTGKEHVDNHSLVEHSSPNTSSSQLYKAILDGKSRNVFNGRVVVKKSAQKITAFQLNKNLLLTDDVEVDTKPQLEIHADDVKCSHGAAIGAINREELFYLESRGIRPDVAERMLSQAFAFDVLEKCTDVDIKSNLLRQIEKFFGAK